MSAFWDELTYPIPNAPPVTTATLPSRSWISFFGPMTEWSADCILVIVNWVGLQTQLQGVFNGLKQRRRKRKERLNGGT